jgi:uncharacterized protein (TIGR03118 family)
MHHARRSLAATAFAVVALAGSLCRPAAAQRYYLQVNLVSDVPGLAPVTDPKLVNPWGLAANAASPFWVSDNGTGLTTLYNGAGVPQPAASPLVVTIPPPPGQTGNAAPTGQVANTTIAGFTVSQGGKAGRAAFIFATEDGTISGWSPAVDPTHAILMADRSATAVYKGLALLGTNLYAANFREGRVDIFDSHFAFLGSATEPNIPAGFAPFNVENIAGSLVVTYAKQNGEKHDDVRGPGNGFVSILDPNTLSFTRFASGGPLNSPWGLALAPGDFGRFSNDLLIGNFGDGRISAFNARTGHFDGQLVGTNTRFLSIEGLWALQFGNGAASGAKNVLYFTAGIGGEQHGLFGAIVPTNSRTGRGPSLF